MSNIDSDVSTLYPYPFIPEGHAALLLSQWDIPRIREFNRKACFSHYMRVCYLDVQAVAVPFIEADFRYEQARDV